MKNILLGSISVIYSNWLPYASGCLISYCKSVPGINERYNFFDPIYKQKPVVEYRDILLQTDILGLTCYVWNQSYNNKLAAYYKRLVPHGQVVYGGPQVPEDTELKKLYDNAHPHDVSIAGLGEINFAEWLLELPKSNSVLRDVPTPYLDGTFDTILSSGENIKVSFETNRGCPYGCTFCDWGGQARNKIVQFDLDTIYKTINAIYSHGNISELEILDANFGILPRDISIIDKMIECQNKHNNNLRISYSGLAKNGSKHLPVIMEKVFNNLPIDQRNLKISFQTHTKVVLQQINRDNIKNEKLYPLIREFKDKNIPTTSEMIIALPGETADSWLKTLHYNFHDLGIDFVRTYILHVVANTPLYHQLQAGQYELRTKKIIYADNEVEILHHCNSFDFEELKLMFSYFWIFNTFINTGMLKSQVKNLYNEVKYIHENLNHMPFISKLLHDYLELVEKVFSPFPVTELHNKEEIMFFTSTLKGNEINEILNNQELICQELNMYDLHTNFTCDEPNKAISILK